MRKIIKIDSNNKKYNELQKLLKAVNLKTNNKN